MYNKASLIACIHAVLIFFMCNQSVALPIVDYGNAKYFASASPNNRLYINIQGRLSIKSKLENLEYTLLAPHPREYSWLTDKRPYYDMILLSNGASTISFITEKSGNTIISRRFENPTDSNVLHQCTQSPFGNEVLYSPRLIKDSSLVKINNVNDVNVAAIRQESVYGILNYHIDEKDISVEFPVDLININPGTDFDHDGYPWQAVSSRIPVYVGGDDKCTGIREGVLAMRNFVGPFEFVYLCGESGITSKNDFKCTLSVNGNLELYRRISYE